MRKTKGMLESDVQAAICDYLAVRRVFFWRQNTMPRFDKRSGAFFSMPKHAIKGVPDIIAIKDGRFVGLEVKRESGRQSPDQAEFERRCSEAGGAYHVVRSIEDVQQMGL